MNSFEKLLNDLKIQGNKELIVTSTKKDSIIKSVRILDETNKFRNLQAIISTNNKKSREIIEYPMIHEIRSKDESKVIYKLAFLTNKRIINVEDFVLNRSEIQLNKRSKIYKYYLAESEYHPIQNTLTYDLIKASNWDEASEIAEVKGYSGVVIDELSTNFRESLGKLIYDSGYPLYSLKPIVDKYPDAGL